MVSRRSAVCVQCSGADPYHLTSTQQTKERDFKVGACGSSAQKSLGHSSLPPLTVSQALIMAFKNPHGQPPTTSPASSPTTLAQQPALVTLLLEQTKHPPTSGPWQFLLPPSVPRAHSPTSSGLCSNMGGRGSAVFKQMGECILNKDGLELV